MYEKEYEKLDWIGGQTPKYLTDLRVLQWELNGMELSLDRLDKSKQAEALRARIKHERKRLSDLWSDRASDSLRLIL